MYALWSERTKKVEAVGKTLKGAYKNLPEARAKDPLKVITPDEIHEKYVKDQNESNGKREGFGVRNWYEPGKSTAATQKERVSLGNQGYANFF